MLLAARGQQIGNKVADTGDGARLLWTCQYPMNRVN
jgi:hypothetical protein